MKRYTSTENMSTTHDRTRLTETKNNIIVSSNTFNREMSDAIAGSFVNVQIKTEEEKNEDTNIGLFGDAEVKSEDIQYDDGNFGSRDNEIYIGDFLELNTQISDDGSGGETACNGDRGQIILDENSQYGIQNFKSSVDNTISVEITEVINGKLQHFRYKVRPVGNAKDPSAASTIYEDEDTYCSTNLYESESLPLSLPKKTSSTDPCKNTNITGKTVQKISKCVYKEQQVKQPIEQDEISSSTDLQSEKNNMLGTNAFSKDLPVDINAGDSSKQRSLFNSSPPLVHDCTYIDSPQTELQKHLSLPVITKITQNNLESDVLKAKLTLRKRRLIKKCKPGESKAVTKKESSINHNNFPKEKKLHICTVCSRTFTRKSSLNNHKNTHNPIREKPFTCNICGKGISCLSYLKTHQVSHANPWKCDMCGKNFKFKSYLSVHMRHHFNDRPYMCDLCGKSFTAATCLQKHRRIHTGISPYQCNICQKYFAQKVCLDIHMANHTGIKPYLCDVCGKSFPLNSYLKKHIRVEHQTISSTDSNFQPSKKKIQTFKRVIKCKICKMSFKDKLFLQYHIQEQHSS